MLNAEEAFCWQSSAYFFCYFIFFFFRFRRYLNISRQKLPNIGLLH